MKIKTLGYVFSVQKQLPTPEQVEYDKMEEGAREANINIDAQDNQIHFLENMYDAYEELQEEEKMTQTETSLEAAKNTRLQWEVKLHTIQEWYNNQA
jgi:hypothetical protein